MNLINDNWTKQDLAEFYDYEKSLASDEKSCSWEKRIVNTALPCYGKTSEKADVAAKEIKKGDYLGFLRLLKVRSLFDGLLYAKLLYNVKDFDSFSSLLDAFLPQIDNWAMCDALKFNRFNCEKLLELSERLLKSDAPFTRRVGVNVYFEIIKHPEYFDKAFEMLDGLNGEKEYYVNMSGAWLLSFCFIKNREKTFRNTLRTRGE